VDTQTHPMGNTVVPLTAINNMYIGYSTVNQSYFTGDIDELKLFNRALTDTEVNQAYRQYE